MVSFEKALELILTDVRLMDTERVDFQESLHRVLAEDVYSDVDMPPFDKAAMDGFACRREDLEHELEVLETIAAGELATQSVGPRQCIKIMTGAKIPRGADTVIMVEHTEELTGSRIRFTAENTRANIAKKAEDVKQGDLVWCKGMPILPQHIAMFAAVGYTKPLVSKRPRVGILSTGDELVEPHLYPDEGKIRNSNGFQLAAQVKAAHCIPNYTGIVPDDEEATDQAIAKALAENDVVLLSGGVSMGDFDFVPKIMRKNHVDIRFQKVAVKPGRPTVFGRTGKAYIFGLPGNPVSSFINFETFVRPLLYEMMGHSYQARELLMPLAVDFKRKKADRREFLPVAVDKKGGVTPVQYHGSAHIHAVVMAQGLMNIPKGVFELKKGTLVHVRPF
ncbi:MAG: molybdopterin molybdotransferase MoeA [Bacteroidales bacterium]|nr:molybdopterin molybdotransferase MoeA [Bacteroidales bacterium]